MPLFTVTHVCLEADDITPWALVYPTYEAAQRAVEKAAAEDYEAMVDPNQAPLPKYPGLEWSDDGMIAWVDSDDPDHSTFLITEVEIAK